MSYPAISLATATVGRHRCPQKRLQTARQPPVYPNSSPDHRACNSLTPSAVLTPSIPVHRWIRVYAEPRRQPELPDAGRQDQGRAGATGVVVPRYGPQPVVERPAPQSQALAHHAEAASIAECDGGVEAPPAVELHAGPEPVDAGGHRGGESVDAGHRVHPADEQREPLPGHGIGPHKVRWRLKAEHPGGFTDSLRRQVVSLARRQVGGTVAGAPNDALGQQAGQGAVDGGVGLTQDERQLRRVDEGRPAESVEHLSFGQGHSSSVGIEQPGGQPSRVGVV